MNYVSTRGGATALGFEEVLLAGLARDGGLFVPDIWPVFSAAEWRALRGRSYADIATAVMAPFVEGCLTRDDLSGIVHETYAAFRHPAVAPLRQIDGNAWLLELFWGPTIAFKDYALQLLGRLFDHVLAKRGQRIAVLGATSGDTGSAAIEGCKGRRQIDIFIIHPHGRVSDVQRRQMTTVVADNVHNLAIAGSFDDGQDIVKALFNDHPFRDSVHLAAINSINWARVMAQIVYYATSALALGAPDRPVAYAVPTGNFGNIYAAYGAKQMGLPIERLVIGSNRNDILTRFFTSGAMDLRPVEPSLSPSMDIQVSSNLERLLFDLLGRDGAGLAARMDGFRRDGTMALSPGELAPARALFAAHRVDDAGTEAIIRETYARTGELVDPHTAVGLGALMAQRGDPGVPMIALACAHPAKFPDVVTRATGRIPALPAHLSGLMDAEERLTLIPNDADAVKALMRARLGGAGGL